MKGKWQKFMKISVVWLFRYGEGVGREKLFSGVYLVQLWGDELGD